MEKITLDYPVEIGGEKTKELTMRRCKVRDQKAAGKAGNTDEEKETILFANLCSVTPEFLDELDMLDYQKVQETYESFLSPGKKSKVPAD